MTTPILDDLSAGAPGPLKRHWPLGVLVLLVAMVAMAPVIGGPYSPLDDVMFLRNNPRYTPPTWGSFWQHFTTPAFRIYTPLTNAVWHVIAIFGYDRTAYLGEVRPLGFKIASVVTHALAATAAFWVALRLLRNRWLSVFAALVFALHPIQVESVGWTTGLKDELCGLFVLLTLGAYLTFIESKKQKWRRLALLFAVLAVMSKPTAITLPAILIVADCLWAQRTLERRVRLLWPFVLVGVIGAVVIARVQSNVDVPAAPLALRPLVAMDSLAFYIVKSILPFGFGIDYGRTYAAIRGSGVLWWSWVLPTAAGVLVWLSRDRVLWLAAMIFVVPISPVSGIVPFDMQQFSTVADHYAYQSMFGVGLIAARLLSRVRVLAVSRGLSVAVVLGLAVLCVRQAWLWRDMEKLMWHTIAINPNSFMSYGNIGVVAFGRGDYATAEKFARKSVEMSYRDVSIDQLAMSLELQGKMDEAMEWNSRSLDLPPLNIDVGRVRQIYEHARRRNDIVVAEKALRRWILLDPAEPFPRERLREVERARAQNQIQSNKS
jgi:hypothetical protein